MFKKPQIYKNEKVSVSDAISCEYGSINCLNFQVVFVQIKLLL